MKKVFVGGVSITSASSEASASSGNTGNNGGVPAPQAQPLNAATQTASGQPPPVKKKRNLPGTLDPDAEVIALSPKTLMAMNRFVYEICVERVSEGSESTAAQKEAQFAVETAAEEQQGAQKDGLHLPEPSCVHHD